jgi:hypothetical protein
MIGKTLNDRQKKMYTVRNVEYPNLELWKSIPKFSNPEVSYENYLTKIWTLYLGAKASQISPKQLHAIVCIKQSLGGVDGMEDFAAYHRQFIVKSKPLVHQQHLLVREVASLFMSSLSPRLQTLTSVQLEISRPVMQLTNNPWVYAPQIYTVKNISNVVYQVLQGPNLIVQSLAPGLMAPNPPIHGASLVGSYYPQPLAAPAAPAALAATMSPPPSQPFSYSQPFVPPSQPTVKQEDQFEQLMSQIQALTATVSTLVQAQASVQGQNRREHEPCWYCGEPKCLGMRNRRCNTFQEDEHNNLVTCDPQSFKITMKDGQNIMEPHNVPMHQRTLQMMPRTTPLQPTNPVQLQTMGNYFFNKIPSSLPAIPVTTVNTVYVTAPSQATMSCIEEVDEDKEAVKSLEDQIQALAMMASDSKRQFEEIKASIFELNKKKNNYNRRRGLQPGPSINPQGINPTEPEAAQPAPGRKPPAMRNPAPLPAMVPAVVPAVVPLVAAVPTTYPTNAAKVFQPCQAPSGPPMGYVAPIEDWTLPPKLVDCIFNQTIEFKLSELLSVSSDMRKGIREKVMLKHIPIEPTLIQGIPYEDQQATIFIQNGKLIHQFLHECPADHLVVADDRADMQSLPMWINYMKEEECILNCGVQICSISKDV